MKENLFIAFEGIDGCGKSTQAKILAENLRKDGYKVYLTCEPTDSLIGSIIRNIFNHKIDADQKTIAGLFVADRLDHLLNKTNGILKKLEEGYTVITDRYYFSSYAYHGVHNISLDWIIQANSLSSELLRPDINIYIDIDPETSMKRVNKSRSEIDMYENIDNLKKVRDKYLESFEKLKLEENIFTVDGNQYPEIISMDIFNKIKTLIKTNNKQQTIKQLKIIKKSMEEKKKFLIKS